MALLDFLGNIGGGLQTAMSGPAQQPFDSLGGMRGIAPSPFDPTQITGSQAIPGISGIFGGQQVADPTQAAPAHHGGVMGFLSSLTDPHSSLRTGLGSVFGKIGDALLQASGEQPLYAPRQQKKQLGAALSQFLGPDTALGKLALDNPDGAVALFKVQQESKTKELPSGVQEFNYYQGLPTDQKSSFEKFLQLTHPGLMSPLTIGQNDQIEGGAPGAEQDLPQVTSPQEASQLAPGTRFRLPDGRIGTVPGGGAGNGVGGF